MREWFAAARRASSEERPVEHAHVEVAAGDDEDGLFVDRHEAGAGRGDHGGTRRLDELAERAIRVRDGRQDAGLLDERDA